MNANLFTTTASGRVGFLLALFAIVVVPAIADNQWLSIFTSTACFTLAGAGVAFMYARLGMVSLAQVGLMGVGGWVMLRLNYLVDWPFEVGMIAGGVAAMAFGWILALPAMRLRGLYLALVTLMAAGGLQIIFSTYQFPNGGTGFWGVQMGTRGVFDRPWLAQSDVAFLRYAVIVATLGFLLIELHRRLAPGRAWALIRRSEAAAMACGVNVTLYKLWAFGLAGFLAGLAGALLAGSLGILDAGTFRASESIMIFALAVVGGANSWMGPIIAAALFRIVPALLNNMGLDADLSFVIFGAGLLHAVITAPDGIAGQIVQGVGAIAKKRDDNSASAAAKPPRGVAAGLSELIVALTALPGMWLRRILDTSISGHDQTGPIVLSGIDVRFGGARALSSVDATFSKPVSGIIGPNGAGKTTLMNVFSGFVESSGKIDVDGTDLTALSPYKRAQWGLRRSFQKEEIADDLTVAENVLAQLDGLPLSEPEKEADVLRALEFVGLGSDARRMGKSLNSFERRLTDVAKCLVGNPKIIMFDEPAGGLSISETQALGDLILKIHNATGAKTLVIDHDVDLIARICEETLVLDFGQKIAFGKTADVLADPKVRSAYLGIEEAAQ